MERATSLLYNLGLLVSISTLSGMYAHTERKTWRYYTIQGILMGIAAMAGMIYPLVIAPGLIFDGRSMIISVTGLFYGPLSAGVASLMTIALRIQQGGVGILMGCLVIAMSAVTGSIFYCLYKKNNKAVNLKTLYLMGIIVHVGMILLMFILPWEEAQKALRYVAAPVLLLYPLATVLCGAILIQAIDRKQREEDLQASEAKYRLLAENVSDAIWVLDYSANRFTYISPSCELLFGYSPEELMAMDLEATMTNDSFRILQRTLNQSVNQFHINPENSSQMGIEIQQMKKDGGYIWVEVCARCRRGPYGEVEIVGVSRDISARKKAEEELSYTSYHDYLTGLYNRRFFEEELLRLDTSRNLPLTILMADVNNLKLINDTLGHERGDKLLINASTAIRKGCREDDIISRIGGDEFALLLPKTDAAAAKQIVKRLRDAITSLSVDNIPITIAMGAATKEKDSESLRDVMKRAEDHMYQQKIEDKANAASASIETILNSLFEKNENELMHAQRVSETCSAIAVAMGLDPQNVLRLKTAGLLHDIGKLGIDEKILRKPTKLNSREWEEIKRHPEIGYRILSKDNAYAQMAGYVLESHEKWDGKGYPRGLKGEQIALQARIIAIADAYDAMTSDSVYRKKLTPKEASEEIIKHTGTQFDPDVAKVFVEKVLNC